METFGATFAGVFASFLLWFGGQQWFKRQQDKKAVEHSLQEIENDITMNLGILDQLIDEFPKIIEDGNIPHFIPHRLLSNAYQYALATGDIRLLAGVGKEWLVRTYALDCESYNRFVENTEGLLMICLLKQDGLRAARTRLSGLVLTTQDTRDRLKMYLTQLRED